MQNFSMDVYADSLVHGFQTIQPEWDIIQLKPQNIDRSSQSIILRTQKSYERFWRFPHAITQQSADIFHVVDHSEAHIVRWLKQSKRKVVVTCHDLINLFYRKNLSDSIRLPLISDGLWMRAVKSMRYADHIIAVSQTTANDMVNFLNIDPAKITVVYNSVESSFLPLPQEKISQTRAAYNISSNTLCLLNVGSNHPRKNLENLIKAVSMLKQRGLSVMLLKAGSDFSDRQKELIREHNIQTEIQYVGKPNQTHLMKLYNIADLLIAPSLHEGFGLTLVEAMACGTPVITSKVSAMPEVVGDSGVLIDPKKPNEIADAAYYLYDNRHEYQNLRQKSLSRVQLFNWEKNTKKVQKIYTDVLS